MIRSKLDIIENDFSYFAPYLLNNIPVIIDNIGENWLITQSITDKGLLNNQLFNDLFGEVSVPVELQSVEASYDNDRRIQMTLKSFLDVECSNGQLYLKDWHFIEDLSEDFIWYDIPSTFLDDWLNFYLLWKNKNISQPNRKGKSDYYFMYVGSRDTMTYVHHDVLSSYSWSVNLAGSKRWYLWPPKDIDRLTSGRGSRRVVTDARRGRYDSLEFPRLADSHCIVVEQSPGQAIFVPAGWYHMVENLGCTPPPHTPSENASDRLSDGSEEGTVCAGGCFTVSINHNWLNGFSVHEVWRFLLSDLQDVRQELSLHRGSSRNQSGTSRSIGEVGMGEEEWHQHCETVLRANARLGLVEFLELVSSRVYMIMVLIMEKPNDTPHHAPSPQDSRGRTTATFHPSWKQALCPDYSVGYIQPSDVTVVSQLLGYNINELPNEEHWLSRYKHPQSTPCSSESDAAAILPASADASEGGDAGTCWVSFETFLEKLNWSLVQSEEARTAIHVLCVDAPSPLESALLAATSRFWLMSNETPVVAVTLPLSAMQYCGLQVLRVLVEILSLHQVKTHLRHSLRQCGGISGGSEEISAEEGGRQESVISEGYLQDLLLTFADDIFRHLIIGIK